MLTILENDSYVFEGGNRLPGECAVKVLSEGGPFLVIFTELNHNPGMSVTNAVEQLITQFCKEQGVEPQDCRFFERYQSHPDTLDEILWDKMPLQWRRLNPQEARSILRFL